MFIPLRVWLIVWLLLSEIPSTSGINTNAQQSVHILLIFRKALQGVLFRFCLEREAFFV